MSWLSNSACLAGSHTHLGYLHYTFAYKYKSMSVNSQTHISEHTIMHSYCLRHLSNYKSSMCRIFAVEEKLSDVM